MSTQPIATSTVNSPSPSPPPGLPLRPGKAAARVKIADRVARAFPPLACARGYRYFDSHGVSIATLSDSECVAEVKGQRTQTVRLRIDDGRLCAICSCAAKTLGPPACRHVWATVLEIDRRDAFGVLRGTLRPLALSSIEAPPTPAAKIAPPVAKAPAKTPAAAVKATKPTETAKTTKTAKTPKKTKTAKTPKKAK